MDDLQSVPGSSANSKKKTLIASEQEREDGGSDACGMETKSA